MESQQPRVSLTESFSTLADPYRRRILVAVGQSNPRKEDELASSEVLGDLGEEYDEFVSHRLYHIHLPKLADAGFISWDHETGVITRGPRFEEVRPLIELLDRHADELPANWP